MTIEKRDNMGFAIAPALIVLLVMFGALCLVVCGYAVHRLIGITDNVTYRSRTIEQDDYMREVRDRNLRGLMEAGARPYGGAAAGSRWGKRPSKKR